MNHHSARCAAGLAIAVALAGCGSGTDTTSTESTPSTGAVATTIPTTTAAGTTPAPTSTAPTTTAAGTTTLDAGETPSPAWPKEYPDDPPEAWLMPLIADAVIGLAAPVVAILLWRRPNPTSWVMAIAWSAIGCFDALAAFIIESTDPWPEFFMLELFGRSMFFAAAALHAAIIYLLARPHSRLEFNIAGRQTVQPQPA